MCASLVLKILFRSACAKKGRERRFCCNAIFKENVFQRVERCRQFVSSCWPLRVFVVEAGNNERQSRSPKVVELPWQCRRRMSLGLFSSSWFASFEKKSSLRKRKEEEEERSRLQIKSLTDELLTRSPKSGGYPRPFLLFCMCVRAISQSRMNERPVAAAITAFATDRPTRAAIIS